MGSEEGEFSPGRIQSLYTKNAHRFEGLGIFVLLCAITFQLVVSWRKWPDVIVDFGRELYIPWRLSEGALLYRDIDHYFGPLSHYFNSLVFTIFGPGFMHLVTINLAIYAGIIGLLYYELRAGWGRLAAFVGTFTFITIFSFNQYVGIGNYNFATPYAHETTHGFFAILVLISLYASWLRSPSPWKALCAGLCCGICVLLKLEIIVAASAVTICALIRAFISRVSLPPLGIARHTLTFIAGGFLPVVAAALALRHGGASSFFEAFCWANNAWLDAFKLTHLAADPTQRIFLGSDNISGNLFHLLIYGAISIAGILLAAKLCQNTDNTKVAAFNLGIVTIVALMAASLVPWFDVARAFPLWLLTAIIFELKRPASIIPGHVRWLLLVAAIALLARMALFPRIFHYGYCQASLAGVLVIITIVCVVPHALKLDKPGRLVFFTATSIFLALGMFSLEKTSIGYLRQKTQPVGEGVDMFYGYRPGFDPFGLMIEKARIELRNTPDAKSLLVIPEGPMLNYLSRKPSTIREFMLLPFALKGDGSRKIIEQLRANPPQTVALITRNLREFGVERYGESPDNGSELMSWVDWNYKSYFQIGADPFDQDRRGCMLLKQSTQP